MRVEGEDSGFRDFTAERVCGQLRAEACRLDCSTCSTLTVHLLPPTACLFLSATVEYYRITVFLLFLFDARCHDDREPQLFLILSTLQ